MPSKNNMRDRSSSGSNHKCISKKMKRREGRGEEAKETTKDPSASKQPKAPPLGEGNLSVLLLGEGDFSFAAALAYVWDEAGGDCDKVTATALGTEASTLAIEGAEDNTEAFKAFGGTVLYGVDATALHRCDALYPRMGKVGLLRPSPSPHPSLSPSPSPSPRPSPSPSPSPRLSPSPNPSPDPEPGSRRCSTRSLLTLGLAQALTLTLALALGALLESSDPAQVLTLTQPQAHTYAYP